MLTILAPSCFRSGMKASFTLLGPSVLVVTVSFMALPNPTPALFTIA